MQTVVGDFLAGRGSLDSAAARLLPIYNKYAYYTFRLSSNAKPGTASIEAIPLAPSGHSLSEPRIAELFDAVMRLDVGSERYEHMKRFWARPRRRDQ